MASRLRFENGLIWWDRLWSLEQKFRRTFAGTQGGGQAQGLRQVDEDAWFLLGPSLAGVKDPAGRTVKNAGPKDLICSNGLRRAAGLLIFVAAPTASPAPQPRSCFSGAYYWPRP